MLDEFADAEDLADEPELGLQLGPRLNGARRVVGSVEVPGVESAEVLNRSQQLISAHGGCNIAEVVGHRWVVHQCISHHLEECGRETEQ